MTSRPITEVTRHDVIRFVPVGRRNRICVAVDAVTFVGTLAFVHGVRSTDEGVQDSQSQRHAWPVDRNAVVEVTA